MERQRQLLTVLIAEDQAKDGIQAKKTEEVPADTADPGHVHVGRIDAALEHQLEAKGEREWKTD